MSVNVRRVRRLVELVELAKANFILNSSWVDVMDSLTELQLAEYRELLELIK